MSFWYPAPFWPPVLPFASPRLFRVRQQADNHHPCEQDASSLSKLESKRSLQLAVNTKLLAQDRPLQVWPEVSKHQLNNKNYCQTATHARLATREVGYR